MSEEELRTQRKELAAAINDALSASPEVEEVIGKIRARGYEVFLMIEATIGLSPREDGELISQEKPRLDLTDQDERFLRSLKIRPS